MDARASAGPDRQDAGLLVPARRSLPRRRLDGHRERPGRGRARAHELAARGAPSVGLVKVRGTPPPPATSTHRLTPDLRGVGASGARIWSCLPKTIPARPQALLT